ncbi:MAG: hypothetical protein J1E07_10050 [Treponema sp.]|nr:hypothetical protein [Treponema sp.]
MKKIFYTSFVLFLGFFLLFAVSCTEVLPSTPTQNSDVRYCLFPTKNMWTFLKLDTMTGQIWQVQFSTTGDDYRFETILSSVNITDVLKIEKKLGRFTLYPTENMYNFVMLDQINGYTYQVQWNGDKENRFVVPISD